jgi:hypothetical protein
MSTVGGFVTSKYYTPGLGYSNNSGPPFGALGLDRADPSIYNSNFFTFDTKGLFPVEPAKFTLKQSFGLTKKRRSIKKSSKPTKEKKRKIAGMPKTKTKTKTKNERRIRKK